MNAQPNEPFGAQNVFIHLGLPLRAHLSSSILGTKEQKYVFSPEASAAVIMIVICCVLQ